MKKETEEDKLLEEKEKLERRIIEIDKLLEFGEAE